MATTAIAMIPNWTVVNTIGPGDTSGPGGNFRLKKLAPQIAWSPFWMIRLTAMVTMIIPNSLVPCRMNGV